MKCEHIMCLVVRTVFHVNSPGMLLASGCSIRDSADGTKREEKKKTRTKRKIPTLETTLLPLHEIHHANRGTPASMHEAP